MKKEMKTQRTKEKILEAAMAEFGANGYAGASLNSICSTGISKGLLYHNFENKEAIYLACVDRCFHKMTDYLKSREVGASMERYMNARMEFLRDNEGERRLFLEALIQPPALLAEQIDGLRGEFDAFNVACYQNMLAKIRLRENITQEDAIRYFTLMQTMYHCFYHSPSLCGLPFPEAMEAHEKNLPKLLDFMLYGIAEGGEE